jgi:hypothetical protein
MKDRTTRSTAERFCQNEFHERTNFRFFRCLWPGHVQNPDLLRDHKLPQLHGGSMHTIGLGDMEGRLSTLRRKFSGLPRSTHEFLSDGDDHGAVTIPDASFRRLADDRGRAGGRCRDWRIGCGRRKRQEPIPSLRRAWRPLRPEFQSYEPVIVEVRQYSSNYLRSDDWHSLAAVRSSRETSDTFWVCQPCLIPS